MKRNSADSLKANRKAGLCGINPVMEALCAGRRKIEELLVADGASQKRLRELIELARAQNIPVRRVPRAAIDREAGASKHQGVIARVAAARYADAEELLDSIGDRVRRSIPPLVLVLDGVEDPRNLGAILRTAECAGVQGVFVPERRAVGLTDTVAKASAGALEHVAVARAGNLVRLLEQLKERNVWCVGAAAEASTAHTVWDWKQPTALVLGGEGTGLHRLVRERCDALVRIPLVGRVESLNVSVAAGIILFEALRQREST